MAEDASGVEIGTLIFQQSPKRGHSNRSRKPNPIYDKEEDLAPSTSRGRKQARPVATSKRSLTLTAPDKKTAQSIGVRLRNLLKLPKAHKWVCYEWFYSNIDAPLFQGDNDFCICLKESFPQLKTRKLKRAEWCKIRRLMGKPRRCSAAFFAEERALLQTKRQKIRQLQQRKTLRPSEMKDLPDDIPMPLVIGTKVTARLRKPQDGLFTGTIDALDSVNNTYRITFDRPGLGTHSIPDCEVLSNEPQETMPLSSYQTKQRPRLPSFLSPSRLQFTSDIGSPPLGDNDPILGSSPLKDKLEQLETYGGFPVKFLILVTRLTKILGIKKERVKELKDMNTEAEKLKSYGQPLTVHFQQKYAATILELERLNKDLNEYLVGVQQFSQQIAPEQGLPVVEPSDIKKKCDDEASNMVCRLNVVQGRKMAKNQRVMDLISKLTSLLLQIKIFAESDMASFELKSLQESLKEIKDHIDPANMGVLENSVEIHINHIQSGLTQMGNLSSFAVPTTMAL